MPNLTEKESRELIEWTEPYGPNEEQVWMRVRKASAVSIQRYVAASLGKSYEDEQAALLDFMTVHWAIEVETLSKAERKRTLKEVAERLRHVGDEYGKGGHTHRQRMLNALAKELETGINRPLVAAPLKKRTMG